MQTPELPVLPKRILIVGAGPAGLVTLRNFIELGTFERVELVERRDDVGGVWYLDPSLDKNDPSRFPSPAYPGLVGNVLPEFLSYHGFPFPPPAEYDRENRQYQPFPTLTETHNYLKAFAKPFIEDGRLRLGKEVVKVEERPLPNDGGNVKDKWHVVLRDWADPVDPGKEVEELWDAVAVCVGWYDNPIWPETQGLDEVREKGLAKHAKGWRGPEGWEGKRTLVIGNANSSNDIAAQLAAYASTSSPIYRSIRRPNFPGFVSLPDERIEDVPPVKRYTLYSADPTESTQPATYKVKVELEGGRIIDDIDVVWVGTGYKPYVPWLHVLPPPFQDPELDTARQAGKTVPIMSLLRFNLPETLADSSNSASDNNSQAKPNSVSNWHSRIPLLYRHLLFALSPSLAFVLSTMSYTPFTIADLGSLWIGLAWSDDEEWAAHTNTDIEAKDSKGQANGVVVDGHGESVRSGMTGDHSSKKGGKGRVTYPATIEERLKYERNKLELIESGRKEVAASVSSSSSSTSTVTTDNGSTAASDSTSESNPNSSSSETQPPVATGLDSSKTASADTHNHFGTTETTFTPTPTLLSAWLRGINGSTPSALNSYSVLGAYEEEYAKTLREDVVRARPYLGAQQRLWSSTSTDSGSETELESESKSKEQTRTDDVEGNPGETSDEKGLYKTLGGGLPEWGPERTKKREGMYPVKLASLYWMRERGRGGNREVSMG